MFFLCACAAYKSPPMTQWDFILNGATYSEMTDTMKVAKRPVYLGAGGKLSNFQSNEYGRAPSPSDVNPNEMQFAINLERELYDSLLSPGVQTGRVGTDVVLLITRDTFMYSDAPEISDSGARILRRVADVLKKYNTTWVEITGYTDAMRDKAAAAALSLDMAKRVAVFFVGEKISPTRLFINGRGAARPIAAQDDNGRRMNRRIEIRISPVK